MASKSGPKEKEIPAWRREGAGTSRSFDDRFSIVSEGSGRWFLRDHVQLDDLGQPRTTGPYATLAEAKAGAEAQRQRKLEASPLAGRLKAKQTRPAGGPTTRASGARETKPVAAPPPRTWLDRLAEKDRAAAQRARSLIAALEGIGIANAEAVVRRDAEGGRPTVAEAVLTLAIRREIGKVKDPNALLGAVLKVVSTRERLGDDDRLPGWRLVEDREPSRRLHVTFSDVVGEESGGKKK